MPTVVKVGGRMIDDPGSLARLAASVAALPGRPVVVHGGGSGITAWQERVGLPTSFCDGLRVTSLEAMEITAMVLSGWMNKRLVAALLSVGETAVGLSGEDGGLFRADWKDRDRLGEVGEIVGVDATAVRALQAAGLVPVVSPVSRGPGGTPLNVNADEAAIVLAVALRARKLLLVSDVPGVLVDGMPQGRLAPADVDELLDARVVTGGMAVKVAAALRAARNGVEVRIGGVDLLDDPGAGTCILAADEAAGAAA